MPHRSAEELIRAAERKRRHRRHARLQLALTVLWALLIIPTMLWWKDSVPFLVAVSVYANVAGHWAAYEAARDDS